MRFFPILIGLSLYLAVRLAIWSRAGVATRAGIVLTVSFLIGISIWNFQDHRSDHPTFPLGSMGQWASWIAFGFFGSLLIYTLMAEIVGWVIWLLPQGSQPESSIDFDRRRFFTITGLTAITTIVGVIQAVRKPKVYEREIPIVGLPEAFHGYRIVQISDLHVGPTIGAEAVQVVVDIANSLNPDMIALTGDFVDGTVDQLRDGIAPLASLKSKDGTFFVTGNHEYYSGAPAWIREMTRLGAKVLLNEHIVLEKTGGAKLVVAGVTDYSGGHFDPTHESSPVKSVRGAPEGVKRILLAHQPESWKKAAPVGFDLMLSGHTHGGQFFPWVLFMPFAHKYWIDLNRHEKMWIYVNRGTSYWGPPIRFTIPREITLLKLKRVTS